MAYDYALASHGASGFTCTNFVKGTALNTNWQDGDDSTYSSMAAHCDDAAGIWIDLAEQPTIAVVELLELATGGNCYSIQIDSSVDGTNWTTRYSGAFPDHNPSFQVGSVQARFWRCVCLTGSGATWYLKRVSVWGDEWTAPTPGVGELAADALMKLTVPLQEITTFLTSQGLDIDSHAGHQFLLQVALWINWQVAALEQTVENLMIGGGDHSVDDVYHLLETVQTLVNTYGANHSHLLEDHIEPAIADLDSDLGQAVTDINANTDAQATALALSIGDIHDHAHTIEAGVVNNGLAIAAVDGDVAGVRGVVDDTHTDVAAVAVELATVHNHADSIKGTVEEIQQHVDAVGSNLLDVHDHVDTLEQGHADILTAIGNIQGGDVDLGLYPGIGGVSLGTLVEVDGEGTVTAAGHGVGGQMDGILLEVTYVPARVTSRLVQGHDNYRFAGWLCFRDSDGWCDEFQYLNLDKRAYRPIHMSNPAACMLGFAPGVIANVQPWKAV